MAVDGPFQCGGARQKSGRASAPRYAAHAEGTYLVPLEQVRFSNGEGKIKLKDTVRGKDVYILSDIGNYSCTYQMFGLQTTWARTNIFRTSNAPSPPSAAPPTASH